MSVARARTVWPASTVITCPARGTRSFRSRRQRRELGHLAGLGAGEPLGDHRAFPVGGGGQQVRDQAVGACGAADRLAVHGDRRQLRRGGDGEGRRRGQGAAGQAGARVIGQLPDAQIGEDPHDRVRVRRRESPQCAAAAPQRGQDLRAGGTHPRGDVLQGTASAQHRRRAHRQDARQGRPDPAPVTRIGDQREARQQIAAAGGAQPGGAGGQLIQRGISGRRRHCGHGRLDRQRSPLD